MLQYLIYIFIGISLSMDAFSLAISIGTTYPTKKEMLLISIMIGLFHLLMPTIGAKLVDNINIKLIDKTSYITAFVFLLLAIEMIINRNKEERIKIDSIFSIITIAFAVSLDSFTVGIAFGITGEKILISSLIFSIISSLFTYFGLFLGKKIRNQFKKQSLYLGVLLLLLVSLKYLLIG